MIVTEIQALDYPFFIDVRPNGLDTDNPVVNSLPLATMSWASPVTVDEAVLGGRSSQHLNTLEPCRLGRRRSPTRSRTWNSIPNSALPVSDELASFPLGGRGGGFIQQLFQRQAIAI